MMRRLAIVIALAAALSAPASAQPAGVQVTPVILVADADSGQSSVRVRNWREREVSFEAIAYAWSQADGEDVLEPTNDIMLAPSTFVIAAQGEQIVRIAAARGPANDHRERAYRLILRELPSASEEVQGFRVQLQFSLPVFAQPAFSETRLSAVRGAAGISLRNAGNTHVRLMSAVSEPQGAAWEHLPRYLLAGEEITRPQPDGADSVTVAYVPAGLSEPLSETIAIADDAAHPR
ncbi:MAG: fimbria/pilus periplasmic chaperone [Hyphomonadaceae bacterium]|nr:fimbria/pilus periplasmic chaperone [Hyphomonadaceae bacterium]